MSRVEGVRIGRPVWMDLTTSDLGKASAFYGDLFGWSLFDVGADFGHYNIVSKNGHDLAGMMPKSDEMAGMPDAWTVYFGVEDVAATAAAVKAAGGQVMFDSMQIGDQGTMAVIVDPTGAVVGLWQPGQRKGFELENEHGTSAWYELLTRDFDAASAFYRTVLGVEVIDHDFGEDGPAYRTITIDGQDRAGIMDAAAGILPEGVPSNWLLYFGVDDTDAAVTRAQELGGSILAPAADTPNGRFALLGDPTGAAFAVISVGD